MKLFRVFATTVIVAFAVYANAEVYRWTDENGRVHFSDKPVGDKAETVDIQVTPGTKPNPVSVEERRRKAQQFLRSRELKRQEEAQQRARARQGKEKRRKLCAELREEYRQVKEAGAVYVNDKNGDRQFLEQAERKAAEARLKEATRKACKEFGYAP